MSGECDKCREHALECECVDESITGLEIYWHPERKLWVSAEEMIVYVNLRYRGK
jgi:hypothetical protein